MWGEAHPDDLSRCGSYDEFITKLNLVNAKIYNSLRNGGRHAMLIGDMRRNGKYYCMIKDLAWYGDLEAPVIKVQHNTVSGRKTYANRNFIPIEHEYMLIFRKNSVWAVPVKITRTEQRNLFHSKLITWRDLVQAALEQLGGKGNLSAIYEVIANAEKIKVNEHWQAKVRQTLQRGDEFAPVERGVWALKYSQDLKSA
ncbi:DNA methylase N-4/N-6 [Brevibacillus sp. NPDC058079]|uniref:DNA methylase N-4/N-6 n=1 Tax=Brevibacillus sp. NPDC058079 TaxID=3346330 RepID=UPI0036E76569